MAPNESQVQTSSTMKSASSSASGFKAASPVTRFRALDSKRATRTIYEMAGPVATSKPGRA
jgi:hypothetical protein